MLDVTLDAPASVHSSGDADAHDSAAAAAVIDTTTTAHSTSAASAPSVDSSVPLPLLTHGTALVVLPLNGLLVQRRFADDKHIGSDVCSGAADWLRAAQLIAQPAGVRLVLWSAASRGRVAADVQLLRRALGSDVALRYWSVEQCELNAEASALCVCVSFVCARAFSLLSLIRRAACAVHQHSLCSLTHASSLSHFFFFFLCQIAQASTTVCGASRSLASALASTVRVFCSSSPTRGKWPPKTSTTQWCCNRTPRER
jgi:hypothetical protein